MLTPDYWFPICDHCDEDATGGSPVGDRWGCDIHRKPTDVPMEQITHWATWGIRKPLIRCDVTPEVWAAHVDGGWTDCGLWAAPPGVPVVIPPLPVEPAWTPHDVLDIFGRPVGEVPLPPEPDALAEFVEEW